MAGQRQATSQNLTGVWSGRYFYPRELAPVSFVATLIETAASLTGTIHEPAGPATDAVIYATLQGQRHGRSVSFIKTYDRSGLQTRPLDYTQSVTYSGILNGDATEIEGTWRISENWSGKFLMIREPGKVAAVARKVAERA